MNHRQLQQHIFTIVLAALVLVGCGNPIAMTETRFPVATIETKTSPTMSWLGMQYPQDKWRAETVENTPLLHGLLTHLTLLDCQVMVLAVVPTFTINTLLRFRSKEPFFWSTSQETTTNNLTLNFVTAENRNKDHVFYYEVFDRTGFFGSDNFRLGYFLFNQNSNVETCRKAFRDVLITLQVAHWPKLPVAQGGETLTAINLPTPYVPGTLDRHDPVSVLNAYFYAWKHGDKSTQMSLLLADEKYVQKIQEPVDSLELLEIRPDTTVPNQSSIRRSYNVFCEITVKGKKQIWPFQSYILTWNAERDSWLITVIATG